MSKAGGLDFPSRHRKNRLHLLFLTQVAFDLRAHRRRNPAFFAQTRTISPAGFAITGFASSPIPPIHRPLLHLFGDVASEFDLRLIHDLAVRDRCASKGLRACIHACDHRLFVSRTAIQQFERKGGFSQHLGFAIVEQTASLGRRTRHQGLTVLVLNKNEQDVFPFQVVRICTF
jgi:hypothetical protein